MCSVAVHFLSSNYIQHSGMHLKDQKTLCDYNFFAVYPNEISGMEEKQQHSPSIVLFQALAIK